MVTSSLTLGSVIFRNDGYILTAFINVLLWYLDVLLIFTEVIAYPVLIRPYLGSFFTIYLVTVNPTSCYVENTLTLLLTLSFITFSKAHCLKEKYPHFLIR